MRLWIGWNIEVSIQAIRQAISFQAIRQAISFQALSQAISTKMCHRHAVKTLCSLQHLACNDVSLQWCHQQFLTHDSKTYLCLRLLGVANFDWPWPAMILTTDCESLTCGFDML